MYLANAAFTFLGSSNGIVQSRNMLTANSGIFSPAEKPQTALQNISNQIISNQARDERLEALSKSAQIRRDTYVKTDEATSLEEAPTELLELFLHNTRLYLTISEGYEQELSDFKEQLQEWDQTIQGYQDILDGKAALPEGQTMESILLSYEKAQKDREQFRQDGIAHINENRYGEIFSNERPDRTLKATLGEDTFSTFAAKDPSDWLIDPSATDIYSEIDRVLSEAHGVTDELQQGVDRIYSILKERGYGEKYKGYLESWADPQNSYFDKTREMNIQKLMIERLMKEPLNEPLNEI